MTEHDFSKIVKKIIGKDPRYGVEAYSFVRGAVDFTVNLLNKPKTGPTRHISGVELLDGIRRYALQQFGPMALTVLKTWGIKNTCDFGEIVFNLVNADVLGKTKEDKKEDFAGGYDFFDAFAKPFTPKKPLEKKYFSDKTENKQTRRTRIGPMGQSEITSRKRKSAGKKRSNSTQ